MNTGVYFQSWSSRWASDPKQLDLTNIDAKIGIVYIAFVDPKTTYASGQNSWATTGLQFSMDFAVVKQSIALLRARGVAVMLSVGGSADAYKFPKPFVNGNAFCLWALCQDLGCNGLDIDWEDSYKNRDDLTNIIKTLAYLKDVRRLSAACWSTGAYPNDGSDYQGMNIASLQSQGLALDWINIMSYDAGPTYDMEKAYNAYQAIFQKPIYLGLLVGQPGWGGYLTTEADVKKAIKLTGGRVFIWAYQRDGTPSVSYIVSANATTPITFTPAPPTTPTVPVPALVYNYNCPNCKVKLFATQ